MARPRKTRIVKHRPKLFEFGPQCDHADELPHIMLTIDQLEAMRLADLEGHTQDEAAELMNVSRQTFGRIIEQGRKIVANALINGKIIDIEVDPSVTFAPRKLKCEACEHIWETEGEKLGAKVACPECGSLNVSKMNRCGLYCECHMKVSG